MSFHPPAPPDSKSKRKGIAQESPRAGAAAGGDGGGKLSHPSCRNSLLLPTLPKTPPIKAHSSCPAHPYDFAPPQPDSWPPYQASAKKSTHPLVPPAPRIPPQKGISLKPGSKKTPASRKHHLSPKPSMEVMTKYFQDPPVPAPTISSESPQELNEAFVDENLSLSIPDDPKTIRSLQQALLLLSKIKGGTNVAVETNCQMVNLSIKIEELHERKRLYQSSQEFYKAQLTQLTDLESKKNFVISRVCSD